MIYLKATTVSFVCCLLLSLPQSAKAKEVSGEVWLRGIQGEWVNPNTDTVYRFSARGDVTKYLRDGRVISGLLTISEEGVCNVMFTWSTNEVETFQKSDHGEFTIAFLQPCGEAKAFVLRKR